MPQITLTPAFLCADDMKKGLRPRKSVRSAMQHEVMFYALAQKEGCVLLLFLNTLPHA